MYQTNHFHYLGCNVSFMKDDMNKKEGKFWYICVLYKECLV